MNNKNVQNKYKISLFFQNKFIFYSFKDAHIQSLEHQLRQMRDELEKSRHNQIAFSTVIPEQPSIDPNIILQKQYQDLKDKLEQRINDLHIKENECVTLKAKVDTYESKEKDLQHYISILKESILIKDQQVNMIQSEVDTGFFKNFI
jgi:hypothetical protein